MRRLILSVFAISVLGVSGCERWELDRQMEELCKQDGGVKAYEVVKVPADWLDSSGRPDGRKFPGADAGGGVSRQVVADRYAVEMQIQTIKARASDDPTLVPEGRLLRYRTVVIRLADQKILGEEITYGRTGGELSLGHPTSKSCPAPRPTPDVVQSVFERE